MDLNFFQNSFWCEMNRIYMSNLKEKQKDFLVESEIKNFLDFNLSLVYFLWVIIILIDEWILLFLGLLENKEIFDFII